MRTINCNTVYIGIDIGLNGAVSMLGEVAGSVPFLEQPLPHLTHGGKREVDTTELWQIITSACPNLEAINIIVEECGNHFRGAQALRSQAIGFGKILGMIEQHCIRHHRVRAQEWQSKILGKVKKGDTKAAARSAYKRLWPRRFSDDIQHMPIAKAEGIIDASLICEHARRAGL